MNYSVDQFLDSIESLSDSIKIVLRYIFRFSRITLEILSNILIFVLVLVIYILSLPVTLIGQLIIDGGAHDWLPEIEIGNRIKRFREDMIEIIAANYTADYENQRDHLRLEIEATYLIAKKKHEIGELTVSFWGGVLAVAISLLDLWANFSQVISVYVLIITFSIVIRILIVEILAYDRDDAESVVRKDRLELMLGWNRAILDSVYSQLAILFLAVLGLIKAPGYEVAKDALENYAGADTGKKEFLKEIVKSQLCR